MLVDLDQMPIVQARPADRVLVDAEPEAPHQVEGAAGGGAGPGHVPGIRRDLGLYQHDVERPVVDLASEAGLVAGHGRRA